MNKIDPIAMNNFFMGLMALMLNYKICRYENEAEQSEEIEKEFHLVVKHIEDLKNVSDMAYTEFITIHSLINYIKGEDELRSFEDLIKTYKYLKILRRFKIK